MSNSSIKPLIKIDHTNYKNAFLFNALVNAILFSILFVANDYIDDHILDRNDKLYGKKIIIHTIIIFIITFLVALLFWNVFGWGKTLFG